MLPERSVMPAQKRLTCRTCKRRRSVTHFSEEKRSSRGYVLDCKSCRSIIERMRHYGIDAHTFQALIAAQCGCCAICDRPFEVEEIPVVDHDHECCPSRKTCGQCVRGLLCAQCNQALGLFKDDPDILMSAAEYLERGIGLFYG